MAEAASTPWANRIVGEAIVDPNALELNPKNWRTHPTHQQQGLEQVLEEVGWVQRIIVNKTTGHVVDGHLRVELARKRKAQTVPVLYVELTEDEEDVILATIDPLSAIAGRKRLTSPTPLRALPRCRGCAIESSRRLDRRRERGFGGCAGARCGSI